MDAWGSVPVWIGTIFTCVSVAVALATFLRANYDRERRQAALVGSWVTSTGESWSEHPAGSGNYIGWVEIRIVVANRSDAPVYDLEISWRKPEEWFEPLPEDQRYERVNHAELAPGATGYRTLTLQLNKETDPSTTTVRLGEPLIKKLAPPEMWFTDAVGRRWVRTRERRIRRARRRKQTATHISIPVEREAIPIRYH
ncbi:MULTISPECIES: hypothetical protein [Microbacterium]|uniref:hypothetical protein n=1 Tax=Microbacterium TaxID=33882 RepID=UPI0013A564D6|nr:MULTISPECIES: hypothetical protein [Microbacterium]